jgi:hypothetical protein
VWKGVVLKDAQRSFLPPYWSNSPDHNLELFGMANHIRVFDKGHDAAHLALWKCANLHLAPSPFVLIFIAHLLLVRLFFIPRIFEKL